MQNIISFNITKKNRCRYVATADKWWEDNLHNHNPSGENISRETSESNPNGGITCWKLATADW